MVDQRLHQVPVAAVDQEWDEREGVPKESTARIMTREQLRLRPVAKTIPCPWAKTALEVLSYASDTSR